MVDYLNSINFFLVLLLAAVSIYKLRKKNKEISQLKFDYHRAVTDKRESAEYFTKRFSENYTKIAKLTEENNRLFAENQELKAKNENLTKEWSESLDNAGRLLEENTHYREVFQLILDWADESKEKKAKNAKTQTNLSKNKSKNAKKRTK